MAGSRLSRDGCSAIFLFGTSEKPRFMQADVWIVFFSIICFYRPASSSFVDAVSIGFFSLFPAQVPE